MQGQPLLRAFPYGRQRVVEVQELLPDRPPAHLGQPPDHQVLQLRHPFVLSDLVGDADEQVFETDVREGPARVGGGEAGEFGGGAVGLQELAAGLSCAEPGPESSRTCAALPTSCVAAPNSTAS